MSIVNVLKNLVSADAVEFDNDLEVDYLNEIKADRKRNPIIKRLKYTGRMKATENLILLVSHYCEEKGMVYTQGMLDIIIPFMLLESCYFTLEEVYAIMKKFLGDFVLNSLQSMYNGEEKCLPFLMCQISIAWILLRYHDIELYNHLQRFGVKFESFMT